MIMMMLDSVSILIVELNYHSLLQVIDNVDIPRHAFSCIVASLYRLDLFEIYKSFSRLSLLFNDLLAPCSFSSAFFVALKAKRNFPDELIFSVFFAFAS